MMSAGLMRSFPLPRPAPAARPSRARQGAGSTVSTRPSRDGHTDRRAAGDGAARRDRLPLLRRRRAPDRRAARRRRRAPRRRRPRSCASRRAARAAAAAPWRPRARRTGRRRPRRPSKTPGETVTPALRSYRNQPPSSSAITPIAPQMPRPGACSSTTKAITDSTSSAMPMMRTGQHAERHERDDQQERADRAREDVPRHDQLEHDQPEPEPEEDEREVGVEQAVQEPHERAHGLLLDRRAGRVQRGGRSGAQRDGLPVHLGEEVLRRGRDQVDHALGERFLGGDARGVGHERLGDLLVASVGLRELADRGLRRRSAPSWRGRRRTARSASRRRRSCRAPSPRPGTTAG